MDPRGLLENLPRNAFRLAISRRVMEHIPAGIAPEFVSNMASLLVDGGIGIHGINISDHLAAYDPNVNKKHYLTFSDSQWRLWCENGVQYINRIQASEWLRLFSTAGLNLLEEYRENANVSDLRVNSQFRSLSHEDIACANLHVVVQKEYQPEYGSGGRWLLNGCHETLLPTCGETSE
jgi:hypothetical protein